jgi:hypothetical protein
MDWIGAQLTQFVAHSHYERNFEGDRWILQRFRRRECGTALPPWRVCETIPAAVSDPTGTSVEIGKVQNESKASRRNPEQPPKTFERTVATNDIMDRGDSENGDPTSA